MDRATRFDRVIGGLYDAALEPERWPAALTATADLLGAVGAQFYFWDRRHNTTPFAVVGRLPDEGNADYLRYYGAIDTRRQMLERVPVGGIMTADLDFDGGRFRRGEFFNDFLVPHGVPFVVGGRPFEAADLSAVIAVLRSFAQGPFEAPEVAALERLMPHLQRAARLHLQMREMTLRSEAAERTLDRLPFGVVVVDASGRPLVINRTAEEMAATSDGLRLRRGRLEAVQPEQTAALDRCVADAVRTAGRRSAEAGGALWISRPSGRRPLAVLVVPLSPETSLAVARQEPAALMLITDLERQPEVLGRRLVALFGLTPAEARLAVALLAGKRLEEVAEERGLRMPTLRSQMRALLDKTGTGRQAELIRLLTALPATRAAR